MLLPQLDSQNLRKIIFIFCLCFIVTNLQWILTFPLLSIIVGLEENLDVAGVGEVWLVGEAVSLSRLSQLSRLIIESVNVRKLFSGPVVTLLEYSGRTSDSLQCRGLQQQRSLSDPCLCRRTSTALLQQSSTNQKTVLTFINQSEDSINMYQPIRRQY